MYVDDGVGAHGGGRSQRTQSWEYNVITAAKGGFKWELVMETLMRNYNPDAQRHTRSRGGLPTRLDLIIIM